MKADEFLDENNLEYELVEQDEPTKDCDDAARARGVKTRQIVKSLIVERDGEKFHCLVPGDRELSAYKFGDHSMVPPEKSREITGQESGTVHPFSTDLKHFIDERLLEEERLSHTTGEVDRGVIMSSDVFGEALESSGFEYEILDIVETEDEDLRELEEKGFAEDHARFLARNGYRREALELSEDHDPELVSMAIQELRRNDLGTESLNEILDRAESENHVKKLVEHLEENGELPENEGFDLEEVVERVLEENQDAVQDYREGKDSARDYLVGQVMKETNGRADSGDAIQLIEAGLDE
jgi:prolyl-tRNA editing enzyme YbaK/EbsC (Cys-tRNA(Pro) deacylase)